MPVSQKRSTRPVTLASSGRQSQNLDRCDDSLDPVQPMTVPPPARTSQRGSKAAPSASVGFTSTPSTLPGAGRTVPSRSQMTVSVVTEPGRATTEGRTSFFEERPQHNAGMVKV